MEVAYDDVIAIDVGRNGVKGISRNSRSNRLFIPSVVGEYTKLPELGGKLDSYQVIINDEPCFVGDLALLESRCLRRMATESKIHSETKTLFLVALHVLMESKNPLIITSLPVDQHTTEKKEEFVNLLRGNHIVTVDESTKALNIETIHAITAEAAGPFWNYALSEHAVYYDRDIRGTTRVINIGSRTIDYATFLGAKYIRKDCGTLPFGIMELYNGVEKNGQPSDYLKEQFARRIIGLLSQVWTNFSDEDRVLLSGGGSLILGKEIKRLYLNSFVPDDAIFGNVNGLLKLGIRLAAKG
jgi:plasmid segregation protein ParM